MLPLPSGPARWRGQIAPVAAISVFGLALSMSYPLLNLLLERAGTSGTAIGLNTMAAAVAMVVFAPLLPRIAARVGFIRLTLLSGVGLAALLMGFYLLADFGWWLVLRFVFGFFGTAIFFTSEYWIVTTAPAGSRGRVIAIYTISLSVSFMIGPLIIGMTGVEGVLPFALGAGLLLLGLLPVLWGADTLPATGPEAPPAPGATVRFFRSDPGMLWAVVLFGIIEFGAVTLLPVWAVRTGFSVPEAALIAASFAAGSILLAPLLGWAADHYPRRPLLALVAVAALSAPLAMAFLSHSLIAVAACGMVWGGFGVGLYSLPLTELGARYSGHRLAEANGAVILGYGIGALLSPVALGAAMDLVPPDGVLIASAASAAAYLALIAMRMGRAEAPGT